MLGSRLLLAISAVASDFAFDDATTPKAPGLTFLYSCNATLGPSINYGAGPKGQRVAIPITGGTFSGPKMSGSSNIPFSNFIAPVSSTYPNSKPSTSSANVLPSLPAGTIINLGADWGITDPLGNFNPDSRYGLKTNDGANIFIHTQGPSQKDGKIHLSVFFETGSANYSYLNEIVAVGILTAGSNSVAIDVWQLNSP